MVTIEVECSSCPQKVTIRADHGPVDWRCPNCGHKQQWKPKVLIDVRPIDFRCATNGKKFTIVYARGNDSTDGKLRPVSNPYVELDENSSIEQKIKDSVPDAIQQASDGSYLQVHGEDDSRVSIMDLDLSSWKCAVCGYKPSASRFVHCGRCKEFVCGASIDKSKKPYRFVCYPECGKEDTLDDGEYITEMDAHHIDIRGDLENGSLGALETLFTGARIERKQHALPKPTGSALIPSPAREVKPRR